MRPMSSQTDSSSPWQKSDRVESGLGGPALLRQNCVPESLKITNIHAVLRLVLTENLSLSFAEHFHHGLLGPEARLSEGLRTLARRSRILPDLALPEPGRWPAQGQL